MKDINWIDWVKFVCIFFVYWCHIGMFCSYGSPVYFPYTPFFVNAFFFVSGLLIFRKQLNEPFVCQDTKSFAKGCFQKNGMLSNAIFKIAIPSILFSMIDFLPKTVIRGNTFSVDIFLVDIFIRGTNWFTCALFVAEVILVFLLFTRFRNVWSYFLLCLPLVVLGYFLKTKGIRIMGDDFLPWFYKSGLMALFFLTCGGVYSKYEAVIDKLTNRGGYFQ